jgi:DNA-binding LytR/AlgR family response regulator
MTLTCLIVDDEPLAHKVLEKYIANTPDFVLSGNCYNAHEASVVLEKCPIDILFLDIQMPEINGINFLKTLNLPQLPVVIITTAFRKYALDGFDLGVFDYMVKPIDFERFTKGVSRARAYVELKKQTQATPATLDEATPKDAFFIKSNGKKIALPFEDISHLEGLKDYTIIYTNDKKHLIKGYIKLVEDMLPAALFMRVHKSFIVSKNRIKVVHKNKIEIETFHIPIGRVFRKDVLALLKAH